MKKVNRKLISNSSGATSGSYYTCFTDNLPRWDFFLNEGR